MTQLRFPIVPKGTLILLEEGTKVVRDDGTRYSIPTSYTITTQKDSGPWDEYVHWMDNHAKKANVLVGRRIE